MSDANVQLIKGSGTVLHYANKDPVTGYYDPQDRDRNALQRAADGTWIETQPDEFKLYYRLPSSSSSSSKSSSSLGKSSSSKSSASRSSASKTSSSLFQASSSAISITPGSSSLTSGAGCCCGLGTVFTIPVSGSSCVDGTWNLTHLRDCIWQQIGAIFHATLSINPDCTALLAFGAGPDNGQYTGTVNCNGSATFTFIGSSGTHCPVWPASLTVTGS
jgi:hypothetical protein